MVGILNFIITEEKEHLDQIKSTEDYFTNLLKPKKLDNNDPNNDIFKMRKEFEKLCVTLLNNHITKPEKMTIMRFFTTLDYFEKKNKTKNENRNNQTRPRRGRH